VSEPQVFVSTGGFRMTPASAVRELRSAGITHIELSGGLPEPALLDRIREEAGDASLQVHNYFPPPAQPFVFNLCDPDPVGRERSLHFACEAIELSSALGASAYAFHAGFLGTPGVGDLGRTWNVDNKLGLDEGMAIFAESVGRVHEHASRFGVELLIENNVLTRGTADANGADVLLMTDPKGIREVLALLPPGMHMLLDVAHLRVSASTLGFDPVDALSQLEGLIGGYHLSDNDGLVDSNESVTEDSWFWDHLDRSVAFATIEVNPGPTQNYAGQVALVERLLAVADAGE